MSDSAKLTEIQHTEVATGRTYEALVKTFEHELGYLDPLIGASLIEQKASWSEVEREIARMAGPRGLMIIFRADQGRITSLSGQQKRCSLYLVGNPVIADQIIRIDLRASFYVPFRVCLYDDGGPDGAVISFDRPSSFLAALGKPELTEFGALLDRKIDDVVTALQKP
jgi:uncharacterized protein (DUF302 family)